MTLTARVIRPLSLSDRELDVWTNLCASHVHLNSPFYSVEYVRAVAESQPDVFVSVLNDDGHPIAFLPFQFRNKLWKAIGFAQRAGGEFTDYFGLIAPRSFQIEPAKLLKLSGLRYLYFTHLDQAQLTHGLDGTRPEPGLRIEVPDAARYWSELKNRVPDVVSELARRERKLAREVGELRFTLDVRDWEAPFSELLDRKSNQYLENGGADILDQGKVRLLRKLLSLRSDNCRAVLSTLYAGDTWVASHLGLRGRNVLHYWFPAYNPALKQHGPGLLLLKAVINAGPEAGITLIDRGSGTGVHKVKFANSEHTYYRGTWQQKGFGSAICSLACGAQWRIDRFRYSARAKS